MAGKVALVTGGSHGLGAMTARAVAGRGAYVAINYVASEDKALAVVATSNPRGCVPCPSGAIREILRRPGR